MSSSIFNFDHFQGYARLPRTEKRWHLALACSFLLVALLCRSIPERVYGKYGCKQETISTAAIAALSERTEVLFIGTSHILFAIRPERYSMNVMNLGSPGLSYAGAERLLAKHLERVPNLKVAVIEFDETPLIANTIPSFWLKDPRLFLELGLSPTELPPDNALEKLQAVSNSVLYPIFTLPRMTPQGWKSKPINMFQRPPKGFAPGYLYVDVVMSQEQNPLVLEAFRKMEHRAKDQHVVESNLQALQRTIDMLRGRGVTVVLMHLPHHRSYWNERPAILAARWNQLETCIRTRYGKAPGVLIWDWSQAPAFETHDFCDNHHLNVVGANRLARLLDGKLRWLCKDRRNSRLEAE
ncbi:MAG: hypothetical protein M3347_06155 [Armatimonadota bacterium]|nr:hypothetical protein [Armatimonadota bacterium]